MILAYLDPGAGSMIFQAILAAALTLPLFFRSTMAKVVRRLRDRGPETSRTDAIHETPRS